MQDPDRPPTNDRRSPRCPQCGGSLRHLSLEEVFALLRDDEPELERVVASDNAWLCSSCGDGRAIWTDEELLIHFHPNEARILRRMDETDFDQRFRAPKPPTERDYDADAYMNWFGEEDEDDDEDLLLNGFTTLDDDLPDESGGAPTEDNLSDY